MPVTEKKTPSKAKGRKNLNYEKRTLNHCHTTATAQKRPLPQKKTLKMSDQSQISCMSLHDISLELRKKAVLYVKYIQESHRSPRRPRRSLRSAYGPPRDDHQKVALGCREMNKTLGKIPNPFSPNV